MKWPLTMPYTQQHDNSGHSMSPNFKK